MDTACRSRRTLGSVLTPGQVDMPSPAKTVSHTPTYSTGIAWIRCSGVRLMPGDRDDSGFMGSFSVPQHNVSANSFPYSCAWASAVPSPSAASRGLWRLYSLTAYSTRLSDPDRSRPGLASMLTSARAVNAPLLNPNT